MTRLTPILLPLVASGVLCACAVNVHDDAPRAAAGPSAAEMVAARQAGMHMAATLLFQSVMPAVKSGGDVKPQQHAADGLALFGHSLPGLFPAGSVTPDSRALPSVWENKADFDAKAHAFGAAAERLSQLAEAGDTAGFAQQAKAVQAGCGACHSAYRREEKR